MNKRGLISTLVVSVMGNCTIYIMPLLVGAMVTDRGFSERQAGLMASADMSGFAVATFCVSLFINRIHWRRTAIAGLAIILLASGGTTLIYKIPQFAAIRFMSGLGSGVLVAIATVALGQTGAPDRNYGLMYASACLFGTAALSGLPFVLDRFGLNGAYLFVAMLTLAVTPTALRLPSGRARCAESTLISRGKPWLIAGAVLISIMLFLAEQNVLFTYAERIGSSAGINGRFIGFTLGVGAACGFAGAALVAAIGVRFGTVGPLIVALLLQLTCIALLQGKVSSIAYLLSWGLLNVAWNVMNPMQLGILADVDSTGKALALSATLTACGLAIGPAAAALVMGIHGYVAINWLAGGLALICMTLLLPALSTLQLREDADRLS